MGIFSHSTRSNRRTRLFSIPGELFRGQFFRIPAGVCGRGFDCGYPPPTTRLRTPPPGRTKRCPIPVVRRSLRSHRCGVTNASYGDAFVSFFLTYEKLHFSDSLTISQSKNSSSWPPHKHCECTTRPGTTLIAISSEIANNAATGGSASWSVLSRANIANTMRRLTKHPLMCVPLNAPMPCGIPHFLCARRALLCLRRPATKIHMRSSAKCVGVAENTRSVRVVWKRARRWLEGTPAARVWGVSNERRRSTATPSLNLAEHLF